ncbi:unnamed protein product [Brassica rapa]|uniref:Uncharacterized protein n=1 Tax=Brassica campestris TaxID=3711 RepID=A0A8D9GWT5_BRACM|nr:unnamed protein product [Brassica rapa]
MWSLERFLTIYDFSLFVLSFITLLERGFIYSLGFYV